jgi:phospholipid/cholesterol/gamma-HCH transport system substrate-binding protein/paraquat-inducible protein B
MNENKANYAKIGFFVLAGTALIAVAIGVAGARVFNTKVVFAETYFAESVTGLDLGSPVKYRGVPVGKVERVGFVYSEYGEHKDELLTHDDARQILVVMALDPERFGLIGGREAGAVLRNLVEQGLRVKIASAGVTGLSFLELDYFATGPGIAKAAATTWQPRHPYIPATPSTMTNLKRAVDDVFVKLSAVDLPALGDALIATLRLFQNKLGDADFAALSAEATRLLSELRETNGSVKKLVDAPELTRLPSKLSATLDSANSAAQGIGNTAGQVDTQVQLLARELKALAARATALVDAFNGLVATNGAAVGQAVGALNQTAQTLNRVALAPQGSLDDLVQILRASAAGRERVHGEAGANPAALLFGQPPPPLKENER